MTSPAPEGISAGPSDEAIRPGDARASAAEQIEDWQSVVRLRRMIAVDAPDDVSNHCRLAYALRRTAAFDAADDALLRALEHIPDNELLLLEYAWVAHDRGDWEDAVRRWDNVLERIPANLTAGCCRIAALTRSRRYDEAESAAVKLLAEHRGQVQVLTVWAWIAHESATWPAAAERWQAVMAQDPAAAAAACCFMTALSHCERFDEAEAAGNAALERFPINVEVMRGRAWISHRRNDWPMAIERWRLVNELDPKWAAGFACLATALRALARFDEAEAAVRRAMEVAPNALIHQIEFAVTADLRGDFPEAGRRWDALRERHSRDPAAIGTIGYHELAARLHHLDRAEVTIPTSSSSGATDPAMRRRDLFMSIESLGDNCEFGAVQRVAGAEPLGLLRFASISAANLACALRRRFEGVGDPENVRLEIADTREYVVHDAYGIEMHSFVHVHEVPYDRFLAQILRRIAFLRAKLLADLEEASKLFVYKARGGMSLEQALMLREAIRGYGDTHLLCVLLADADHPPGLVERLGEGLLIGYISGFASVIGVVDTNYDEWLTICERSSRLRQGLSESPAQRVTNEVPIPHLNSESQMPRRVAVVTDAVSEKFIFPIWHRYYGDLFGQENLFVLTYAGCSSMFRDFALGGLIELPVGYDDATRRDAIGRLVTLLLSCYDVMIRVDVDEFLVVDPRAAPSLAAFVHGSDEPYMTARGFDVTQMPDEPPLPERPDGAILKDRAFATPNTALNKTCIMKMPMTWCVGFHWASVYPRFGPLFMLHLKRLDMGWQLAWFRRMFDNIKDNPKVPQNTKDYYYPDEAKIRDHHTSVSQRQRLAGIDSWYRQDLMARFLETIKFVPATGLYHGEYGTEPVLCEIPSEWRSIR